MAAVLLLLALRVLSVPAASNSDREYDYSSGSPHGPERWSSLHRSWTLCSTGSLQSPINLTEETISRDKFLHKIEARYNTSDTATPIGWRNDIILNLPDNAGDLLINESQYKLVQIRIHSPSEHMIKGKTFPAEVHLIHNNTEHNRLAIVAFSFKFGKPNLFIGQVVDLLNNTNNELDPTILKMTGRPYYKYSGSLTSPPCTEGVDWYVIKKNRRMSIDQFQFIHNYVNGTNARPMQPVNGRVVESYK